MNTRSTRRHCRCVTSRRVTATPTTAATSTPTTAPATCSSSPGSASTRTSASSTRTRRCAAATARSRCACRTRSATSGSTSGSGRTGSRSIEPLQKIRLICEAAEHGLAFDLTWDGSFPAVEEPRHVWRRNGVDHARRVPVRAGRRVVGRDRGRGREDRGDAGHAGSGRATARGASARSGSRWPPGRSAEEAIEGFWWVYVPLRFDDYAIVIILQEEADGHRVMNEAVRVWPDREPVARAARLARDRHPLPVGYAPPGGRDDPAHRERAASR